MAPTGSSAVRALRSLTWSCTAARLTFDKARDRPALPPNPFVGIQCQARRRYSHPQWPASQQKPPQTPWLIRQPHKAFSSSTYRRDEKPRPTEQKEPPTTAPTATHPPPNSPSTTPGLSHLTSSLQTILTSLSHRLNTYTGTDYTPISALRARIRTQEATIRAAHATTAHAKEAHATATTAQSTSHKEVVQLLERKHSWTGPDLERYMALVRSEHSDERAVAAAGADLAAAERGLEDARATLERLERRMYHEEQVWSDTIRRNSTWVTFALMGVNLALLLGNVVVVEPWRRRRMVREIRGALDEKVVPSKEAVAVAVAVEAAAGGAEAAAGGVELAGDLQAETAALGASAVEAHAAADSGVGSIVIEEAAIADALPSSPLTLAHWIDYAAGARDTVADLFSERVVSIRMVDATAATLEGVAAGAAGMVVTLWFAGALVRDFY